MKILKLTQPTTYDGLQLMVAIVESPMEPSVESVAWMAGYHPQGYGCYTKQTKNLGDGTWEVRWHRGNHCD